MFACCWGRGVLDQVEDPAVIAGAGVSESEPSVAADEDPTALVQNPLTFGWNKDRMRMQQAFSKVKYEFKKDPDVQGAVGYAFIILGEMIYGNKDPELYKQLISTGMVPVLMSCVQKVLMAYNHDQYLMHSGKEMLAVLGQLVKDPDGLDAVKKIQGGLELLGQAKACPLFQASDVASPAPSGP